MGCVSLPVACSLMDPNFRSEGVMYGLSFLHFRPRLISSLHFRPNFIANLFLSLTQQSEIRSSSGQKFVPVPATL